jgi:hypothetical protein
MKTGVLVAYSIILVLSSVQTGAAEGSDPPGSIRLLPGFEHERGKGIDSRVGRIWGGDGLTIYYDIGPMAGYFVQPEKRSEYLWYREQVVAGNPIRIAFTKEKNLLVTFPRAFANFRASVTDDEALVDMLLMVVTFDPTR